MKFFRIPSGRNKNQDPALAAYRTVLAAQLLPLYLINGVMPQYSFYSGKFYGKSMWS